MTNVIKHTQAANVHIFLAYDPDVVRVRVEDDGQGFDPHTARSGKRKTWGLKNMEERASLLGGRFKVRSSPGEGTTVEVSIPILEEQADENPPDAGR
jgi:signal transduction histidine kinase